MNRRTARRWGLWAERLCVLSLRMRGYRILARGVRIAGRGHHAGEIDIIARRGNVVAFIEVKARSDRETALEALRPTQKQRIMRSAEAFIVRTPGLSDADVRFDLMIVMPWRWPDHLIDAWREA